MPDPLLELWILLLLNHLGGLNTNFHDHMDTYSVRSICGIDHEVGIKQKTFQSVSNFQWFIIGNGILIH